MLNRLSLQGHMVRDPILKTSKDGKAICEFEVCWNGISQKKTGHQKKLYQRCVAFETTAENISKYFSKGQPIIVCGILFTQIWHDKKGNLNKQNKLDVREVHFIRKERERLDEIDWEEVAEEISEEEVKEAEEVLEEISDEEVSNLPW